MGLGGVGTASAMVPRRLTSYQWWLAMAEVVERHWHDILVVEDEADVRDAISNLLNYRAFTVKSAPDGLQAIAQLRDGYRPCLILLDLTMPGMDGVAFRHEQQATAECADIPVLIVSGHDDGKGIAATLGARDFLKKPVRITTLLEALDRHCPHCQR